MNDAHAHRDQFDLEKYLRNSGATRPDSFDWSDPGPGLDDDVLFSLGYMMDIESHTVIYMKELLSTSVAEDPSITAFKGIPFAAPPVGDLRWRAPQPAKSWEGVKDATKFGPIPPQRQGGDDQSEDCLSINVWTPAKNAGAKLPVMFWIYGGASAA